LNLACYGDLTSPVYCGSWRFLLVGRIFAISAYRAHKRTVA